MDRSLVEPYLTPLMPIPTGLSPTGRLRHRIRCVLFDIYGTLFISASGDVQAADNQEAQWHHLETFLAGQKVDATAQVLMQRLTDAIGVEHRRLRQTGIDTPEIRIEEIWRKLLGWTDMDAIRRFAVTFELIVNPVWPMPHLAEVLRRIRAEKIPMGILSNAQFYTPLLFSWFLGQRPEFLGFRKALVLYSYRQGRAKPDDAFFRQAVCRLAGLAILPEQTLYVGNDMRKDILPARSAGFQTALFAGDARSLRLREEDARCVGIRPDLVVTNLQQLIGHIFS